MKHKGMEEKFNEFLKLVVYPVFAYLSMDVETTFLLLVLMIIDSVLGAIKSYRLGYKVKTSIFFWGMMTKLIFIIIPVVLTITGKAIKYDFSMMVNAVMIILVISECYSILGNIYSIKNKEEIEKIDAISRIIKSLRTWMKKQIDLALNKIEDAGDCKMKKDE